MKRETASFFDWRQSLVYGKYLDSYSIGLFENSCKPTISSHFDRKLLILIHCCRFHTVIHCLISCIYSILKRGYTVGPAIFQEVEIYFKFSFISLSLVIPPINHFSPLRFATITYSPTLASRTTVSSHVTGTWVMKRVQSSLR